MVKTDPPEPEDKIDAAVVALGVWLISDDMAIREAWNAAVEEIDRE